MSKTIYLKSTQQALIEFDNQQIVLKNSQQYHTLNLERDLLIKYYPITTTIQTLSLPKIVKLNMSHLPNKDIVVTRFSNNAYEVVIKPTLLAKSPTIEEKQLSIADTEYKIKLYSDQHSHITIVTNDATFVHDVDFELTNLQANAKNNYIILQADSGEQVYLLIVDTNFVIQEEKLFNSLDLNDMLLKGFLEQEDMAKHGVIVSYDFSTRPYSVTQEVVYLNSAPTLTKNEILMPYAFLEAIKVKNYKLARHYLSRELSNKLKEQHLASFFGDFVEIRQNIYTDPNYPIALVYGKNDDFTTQLYSFEIKNDKIYNIIQA